jgi:hypothetical protein
LQHELVPRFQHVLPRFPFFAGVDRFHHPFRESSWFQRNLAAGFRGVLPEINLFIRGFVTIQPPAVESIGNFVAAIGRMKGF